MDRAWTPDTLQALQRVTDVALAHLTLDDLLTELLQRMTEILHTDTAAFLLLDESANELVARAAKGIEEEVSQGVRIPVGRGFAGRVAAERRAIFIEDVDHADILNPILRERGIRSLLGVPLLVEGDVIGVLHVGTLVPRVFSLRGRRAAAARRRPRGDGDRARAGVRARAPVAGAAAGAAARHGRRARLPAAGRAAHGAAGPDDGDPELGHGGVPAARRDRRRAGGDGRRRASRRRSSRASGSRSGAGSRAGSRPSGGRSSSRTSTTRTC